MAVTVKPEKAYAYAEMLEILDNMEEKYVNKIPKKLLQVFEDNKDINYKKHLDVTKPIDEQEISEETAVLIALITVNYWCETQEQKQQLLNLYKENERKYQEELREKYNPDNIFNNNPKSQDKAEVVNKVESAEVKSTNIESEVVRNKNTYESSSKSTSESENKVSSYESISSQTSSTTSTISTASTTTESSNSKMVDMNVGGDVRETSSIDSNSNLPLDYNSLSWYKKVLVKVKSIIMGFFKKNK